MSKKAFIFDMDGVIIDSEPIHIKAKLATIAEFGFQETEKDIDMAYYMGRNSLAFYEDLLKQHPEVKLEPVTMAKRKHEIYKAMLAEDPSIKAIKGFPELLARLKAKGYILGIGSSSGLEMINLVIDRFGIRDYFTKITSGEEVPQTKPDPAIYLLAAERLGVAPEDCTVVEDANAGVQAAKAAGMYCIAYRNPNSGNQDLSLADQIVDSYDEIMPE